MMRNTPLRAATSKPLTIEGVEFFTTTEATQMVGVSRQTLWRWRAEGDVPLGRRYRRKSVVFTRTEVNEIVAFSNRIEPIAVEARSLDAGRTTDKQEAM
jgi:predicted DNA-binding transcriptional regulator AlpA